MRKGLTEKTIYVSNKTNYYELFKFIDNSHFFNFVFLNDGGDVVDSLTEIELYKNCEMF